MSERVMYLKAKDLYSTLRYRTRIGLCELPLGLLMALLTVIASFTAPTLLTNPMFLAGLLLHAVLLAASFLAPWERLRVGAYVVIPLLDFVAIALTRNGAAGVLPGLSLLAIFPVIWISASALSTRLSLLASFVGPFLIIGVSPLLGASPPSQYWTATLLGLAMAAVSVSLRFANLNSDYSQRTLEASRAEVNRLQGENAERALVLEAILDTIDVGLVALDTDGNRTLTNRQQRSYDRLVKASEHDHGDSHFYAADKSTPIQPDRYPVHRAAAGETFANYLVWIGPKESQRAVMTAATAIKDGDGRFAGSVIVSSDVTDMVEALRAKEDFVSNVSHELWTPLTSIIGHLDLVLDDEDHSLPADTERQLSVARRNAERLYALVSNLLASASGAASVHLRPTDLTGLVENSIESAWPQAADTGVSLKADVPDILWTSSDPLRIRQVLDNLLSNAIKYSPDGGTVTVRAREESDSALLEVQDTGIGMSPNETKLIFGKFFRTEAARQSTIPGVGLGLSITKAIVDSHGGTIRCTSQPGAGTTFTVTLPLHRPEQN